MILILQNQTASIKSYASGAISLPANGTVTVAAANQLATAIDGNLFADVSVGNVFISDNVNTYKIIDGFNYLNRLIASFVNLNDGIGNPLASVASQLQTRDVINTSFVAGIIAISTTPVQAKVGGSVLVNRKYVRIQPLNGIIYQGSTNAITSSSNSAPIYINQVEVKSFTDNVGNVWLVSALGSVNVYIEEGS